MKILIAGAILFILSMSIPSLRPKAEAQLSVSLQIFYNDLSPYGDWTYYPKYGYCWHPRVERSFCPYRTRGHWVWSDDYEWIWVSDYDWGWAPFHYGRWFYDPSYGWMWLPDYDWAPAWVVWRSSDSYYGWAPIGPGFNFSIGFGSYVPPDNYWSFVPCRYITSPVVYNYYVSPQQNTTIIHNTTIINNYNTRGGPSRNVFVGGPRRNDVQRFTNVTPVKFRESSRPGRMQANRGEVIAYKPTVTNRGNVVKPSRVTPIEKMKRVEGGINQKNTPQKTQPVRNEPKRNQPSRNEAPKHEQRNQPMRNEQQRMPPQQNNQPPRHEERNERQPMPPQQNNQPPKHEQRNQPPQRTQHQQNQPPQKPQPEKKKGKG